ncbi:hypothetical protein CRUP_004710, partial [Coryphaenoides rupestris]
MRRRRRDEEEEEEEEEVGGEMSDKFLGDQINSYGQLVSFTFTSETPDLLPRRVTMLLEGGGVGGGGGEGLLLSADLSPLTPTPTPT